ncbi:cyclic pyranopterin monophosphate synthase MoaC [Streptomyces solincola]|uniref:Cyclic pyranopterin monophosphate synthase MoaC n=1 Tax=Streptomyces solincola TaxID=2100817 RepID=A0A2S9PNP5_9ACTN|nr:cyclic pyranopterin monophosphate synthase MoaC [Streptomyces solincola]PRH76032.1 cyclic pyranopterin monophosphate synthase MoaC [Streptomyces solincola]
MTVEQSREKHAATDEAYLLDVADNDVAARMARASGHVRVSARTLELLKDEKVPTSEVLSAARVAGILGAKRTSELLPLCHHLAVSGVTVDLTVGDDDVEIVATVRAMDRAGVSMEALTAVSIAALTVIDMIKESDKGAVITDIRVEAISGGKSGAYSRQRIEDEFPHR